MNSIYEWLYDCCAKDLNRDLAASEDEAIDRLMQTLPVEEEKRIDLADSLADLRFHCCTKSFARGVELGLRLTVDFWEE